MVWYEDIEIIIHIKQKFILYLKHHNIALWNIILKSIKGKLRCCWNNEIGNWQWCVSCLWHKSILCVKLDAIFMIDLIKTKIQLPILLTIVNVFHFFYFTSGIIELKPKRLDNVNLLNVH